MWHPLYTGKNVPRRALCLLCRYRAEVWEGRREKRGREEEGGGERNQNIRFILDTRALSQRRRQKGGGSGRRQ